LVHAKTGRSVGHRSSAWHEVEADSYRDARQKLSDRVQEKGHRVYSVHHAYDVDDPKNKERHTRVNSPADSHDRPNTRTPAFDDRQRADIRRRNARDDKVTGYENDDRREKRRTDTFSRARELLRDRTKKLAKKKKFGRRRTASIRALFSRKGKSPLRTKRVIGSGITVKNRKR
jgi:hypothetical protein